MNEQDRVKDSAIVAVTKENFVQEVLKSDRLVLIEFFASWAEPSRRMGQIVENIARDRPEIKVVRIDTDQEAGLVREFNIGTVPTIVTMQGETPLTFVVKTVDRDRLDGVIDASFRKVGIEPLARAGTREGFAGMKPLRFKPR
jgi:thioredoxin 1